MEKMSNFTGVSGTNLWKNWPILREFSRQISPKSNIGKKQPILWLFSGQISLQIDRFCADETSVLNVFLTEVIICSFNNNMLQKRTNSKAFNIMASAQFFAAIYDC